MQEKNPVFKKPILITKPVLVDLEKLKIQLEGVWNSGWLTNNGYKHQELEARIQKEIFNNLPTSLVVNATIGLLLAIKTLKIKGEVITTPFTFPATTHAISWAGLKPVFCDINKKTLNIDVNKIEKLINPKTSAILAVHVFGIPCNVKEIERIAKKYKLKVIYDSAHAFELEINNKSIATFGDASVFSFHATKLFHTVEGGAIVFRKNSLKKKCDILKNFGISGADVIACGINAKMNELQASVGLLMLKEKEKERLRRKIIKETYINELSNIPGIILPFNNNEITKESLQYFAIRIDANIFGKTRDFVLKKLQKNNVFARKYFYPLCSHHQFYMYLDSAKNQNLPIANKVVKEIIALPFHGGLTIQNIKNICNIIKSLKK